MTNRHWILKNQKRDAHNQNKSLVRLLRKYGKEDKRVQEKVFRIYFKAMYTLTPAYFSPVSLSEDWHVYYDTSESFYSYGLVELEEEVPEEEMDNYIYERVASPFLPSQIDCTGQWGTYWVHWHRNPDGRISVVHRVVQDV